jgi:uncharacterized membrane protein
VVIVIMGLVVIDTIVVIVTIVVMVVTILRKHHPGRDRDGRDESNGGKDCSA